jgi:hypothetical protein
MSPFQEELRLCWRQKLVQRRVNKGMCAISLGFTLFCPIFMSRYKMPVFLMFSFSHYFHLEAIDPKYLIRHIRK